MNGKITNPVQFLVCHFHHTISRFPSRSFPSRKNVPGGQSRSCLIYNLKFKQGKNVINLISNYLHIGLSAKPWTLLALKYEKLSIGQILFVRVSS